MCGRGVGKVAEAGGVSGSEFSAEGLSPDHASPLLLKPRAVVPIDSGDAVLSLEGDGLPPSMPFAESVAKRAIAETLSSDGSRGERALAKVRGYDMEGAESPDTELTSLSSPQLAIGGGLGAVGAGGPRADPEARMREAFRRMLQAAPEDGIDGGTGAASFVGFMGENRAGEGVDQDQDQDEGLGMDARDAASWSQKRAEVLGVWLPRLAALCPAAQISVYRRTIEPVSSTGRGDGLSAAEGGSTGDEMAARRLGTQAFMPGAAPADAHKRMAAKSGRVATDGEDEDEDGIDYGEEIDDGDGLGGEMRADAPQGIQMETDLPRAWQLVGVASLPLGPLVESAEREEQEALERADKAKAAAGSMTMVTRAPGSAPASTAATSI